MQAVSFQKKYKNILFPALVLASVLTPSLSAQAQDQNPASFQENSFGTRAGELANQLNPARRNRNVNRTLKHVTALDGQENPYSVLVDTSRLVTLSLHFASGSIVLPRKAKKLLQDVGGALEELQENRRQFLIIGHTDITGDADQNQRLSEKRASHVRDYILKNFNIAPKSLLVAGLGESQLYDPENPESDVNRRIEIVLIDRINRRQERIGDDYHEASNRTQGQVTINKHAMIPPFNRTVCASYQGAKLKDIRPQNMEMDDYNIRMAVPCLAAMQ